MDFRIRPLYEAIMDFEREAVARGAKTVGEVGGSTGYRFVRTLVPKLKSALFIEIDDAKIRKAYENCQEAELKGIRFVKSDFLEVNDRAHPATYVEDNAVDVLRANDFLEHFDDQQLPRVLAECRRIAPFLIAFSPNRLFKHTTYWTALANPKYPDRALVLQRGGLDVDHKQDFTTTSFIEAVRTNGYRILSVRENVGYGWTGVFAVRTHPKLPQGFNTSLFTKWLPITSPDSMLLEVERSRRLS